MPQDWPLALLIGAQKAGTTTLASWLDHHPDLQLAAPKEPHFFTRHQDRGLAWYRRCFSGGTTRQWYIDASTSYSMRPLTPQARQMWGTEREGVPERVQSTFGSAPVIYLVRHPADRAYSAYWHNRRIGRETRSFEEALAAEPGYLETGDYASQIEPWRQTMGRERIQILVFDDLVAYPQETLVGCHQFLEVAPRPEDAHMARNTGGGTPSPAGVFVNQLRRRFPWAVDPLIGLLGLAPDRFKGPLRRLQFSGEPVPALPPAFRDELLTHMAPSIRSLEQTFNIALLERWAG